MASLSLNNKKLLLSIIGGVGVITGVSLKNGLEQLKAAKPNFGTQFGPLIFGLGWLLTGLAIAAPKTGTSLLKLPKNKHGQLAMVASALIFFSVMAIKKHMLAGQSVPKHLLLGFAGGWALLALSLMMQAKFSQLSVTLGVITVALVLGSMWKVLPWQRKKGVVDWFGMPMFTAAWGCVAFANAM